jgi:hypothetical protein
LIEVIEQLIQRLEYIGELSTINMAVIALAALVVVAHTVLAWLAEEEPVLEEVPAWSKSFRKAPYDHLDDGSVIPNFF